MQQPGQFKSAASGLKVLMDAIKETWGSPPAGSPAGVNIRDGGFAGPPDCRAFPGIQAMEESPRAPTGDARCSAMEQLGISPVFSLPNSWYRISAVQRYGNAFSAAQPSVLDEVL
jgi:hypothetical protein